MKRIHVLIAEDKQTYRAELRRTLEQNDHIKVIGEAKVGGEVVTMAQQLAPDVILMDLRIEPMNGLDAIRAIMRQRASIKILVLAPSPAPRSTRLKPPRPIIGEMIS